jgi:ATP-binding cassette, subfamily B, bacterial PglK
MSALGRAYRLLSPAERRTTLLLLGLMAVGAVLEALGIGAVIPAIALLMQGDLPARYPILAGLLARLGNPGPAQLATYGMLGLAAIYLVKTSFLAFLVWRQTEFSFDVQAHLSQRLYTTYLRQPYTFHLQRNSAELIRNAITEVNQFTGNVLLPGLLVVTEGLVAASIAGLLLTIEPLGATVVVLVLGATAWGFHRLTRERVLRWGAARQVHEGLRMQHLQQGLGGAKEVKLLGREADFLAQYQTHNVRSARLTQYQIAVVQFPRLMLELLGVVGLTILVLTMQAQGRDLASVLPAVGLFAAAAFRLMPSVNRMLGAVQALKFGRPVIDLLGVELTLAAPPPARTVKVRQLRSAIALTGVQYTYPGAAAPAINEVSLVVRQGEAVGVVGASGAGKSTVVDVVLGLLHPQIGAVTMDDVDIREELRAWQDQVGYVPQSVYLTDDTLRRNVAFGLAEEQIDDAAVVRAVQAAQLTDFVRELPEGLNSVVGERGVRLSGGQRQRIGIARALYQDPAVLVLDEATSALDGATEQGVMEAVTALHGRKTLLIVAHRLSTVAYCDRVYRLDRGRVVAEGRPAELLRDGPVLDEPPMLTRSGHV